MENEKKVWKYRKAGFVLVVAVAIIVVTAMFVNVVEKKAKDDVYVERWHLVARVSSDALGEYNPGDEGWLSSFHLDYAQVPETVLANNATDWSSDANARGYVDTDNTETDLASEDYAYIVVRCKFDADSQDEGTWIWDRVRVNLTVSGDETISDVGESDNSSSSGDAVVSATGATHMFVNFWWDDGVDGYRITDDGTLNWNITIYEKY